MAEIKKVPNNVKGHKTGARTVDSQILRWRAQNRKAGRAIGKHMSKQNEKNTELREERKLDTPEKLAAKKWF